MRRTDWLHLLLAAAFALLLAGLPELAAELYSGDTDCCETQCEGGDVHGHCPPNCTYGACAKTVSAPLQIAVAIPGAASQLQTVAFVERTRALQGFHTDVFHPPRG